MKEPVVLTCPIRGKLTASALAKDGLTVTEEARRIECIRFLIKREFPKQNIATETVVIKNLGESGRNKLRADIIAYSEPVEDIKNLTMEQRLQKALLVAEIKRDASKKQSGVNCQLKPAMAQIPSLNVTGVYWDDSNRCLFAKKLAKRGSEDYVEILEDSVENLPKFGAKYKAKPITTSQLSPPDNLVATLFNVANIMRSHGVNDEHLRYKETVKLILARYCDERAAASSRSKQLSLQVFPGVDAGFQKRVEEYYTIAARRYSKAKSLFRPKSGSELELRTLRECVKLIQGIAFTEAGNETMQQVFLSFVPAVFKKNLDQFFTPLTLIESMVDFVGVGPNDKVADPAMGTGDFLTAAMDLRTRLGDGDILQRVFGMDVDPKAFELAIINMILNKDGQSNLVHGDSIADADRWSEDIDVALCNPPFGERSIETRPTILGKYDLGHVWTRNESTGVWTKTEKLLDSQQLGILFIERCFKLLSEGGRMAIILPEGYLCTPSYGYVRQWLINNMRLVCLIELPRRIFLKSSADLRSNIVVAQKMASRELTALVKRNYPIHAELVRKVGYKLGAGYSPIAKRDSITGEELRDEQNQVLIDSDFTGIRDRFHKFTEYWAWSELAKKQPKLDGSYLGGTIKDILTHPELDMKPRRLTVNALENKRQLLAKPHLRLNEIADVVVELYNLDSEDASKKMWRLVEGMDIRANEGVVIPQFPARHWQIAAKKGALVYPLKKHDIIIGLVRPERRNIGMLMHDGDDIVGSPDGIAVVRVKTEFKKEFPETWLFAELRSERSRLQFWTESGGTSYGKLTNDQIANVVLAKPDTKVMEAVTKSVGEWRKSFSEALNLWGTIGSENDRRPILNSPIFGLEARDGEPLADEVDSSSE